MPYTPRPGSKTEDAVNYVLKHGSARSKDIAAAVGVEQKSIAAMLSSAVENGVLVACDVDVPGTPMQKEYRVSAGGKPAPFTISRRKTAVRAPAAPVAAEAVPPAEKAHRKPLRAAAKVQRRTAISLPVIEVAWKAEQPASAFRCGLFNSGHLELILRDGSRVELPPEDTRELCGYLDRTLVKEAA